MHNCNCPTLYESAKVDRNRRPGTNDNGGLKVHAVTPNTSGMESAALHSLTWMQLKPAGARLSDRDVYSQLRDTVYLRSKYSNYSVIRSGTGSCKDLSLRFFPPLFQR
jgi:hypothetical protein